MLWVYYTITFGFCLFRHFLRITFLNFFVWLRITDEGSVPEMLIWSILLMRSEIKWRKHQIRSLFSYFDYLLRVTAGGPENPRGHMQSRSTVDFAWFVAFESIKIFCVKIDWTYNFVGLLRHPFWLLLVSALFEHRFSFFELLCLTWDHWTWFSTLNAHMIHIVK